MSSKRLCHLYLCRNVYCFRITRPQPTSHAGTSMTNEQNS